jgi:biopolymer transport protein ExbD
MKKYFVAIVIILQAVGCSAQKEQKLLECIVKSYENAGIEVMPLLNDMENRLIETGVLASCEGLSYYSYLEQISKNGLPDKPQIDMTSYAGLLSLSVNQYYYGCPERKSFSTKKQRRLSEKFAMLSQKEAVSLEIVAKTIISVLSPTDFEIPYYRVITLLIIANLNVPVDTSFTHPDVAETPTLPEGMKTMSIFIDGNNKIHLNSAIVSPDQVQGFLKKFIKTEQANHCIELTAERGVNYSLYVDLQNSLLKIYNSLREEEAHNQFDRPYEELTKEEQNTVNEVYPVRIIERVLE